MKEIISKLFTWALSLAHIIFALTLTACGGGGGSTSTPPTSSTTSIYPRFAYVADLASDAVSQYTIAANGSLTLMTPATVVAGLNEVS